jgi:hypothetical protein
MENKKANFRQLRKENQREREREEGVDKEWKMEKTGEKEDKDRQHSI